MSLANTDRDSKTVLFVCEHGSAKSVVAAAHFNRLASERGLDARAISRGTDPDAAAHPAAIAGLAADGLQPGSQPRPLEQNDLDMALRVITFAELPPPFAAPAGVVVWSVPPVSEDYEQSREAILQRLELLVADLARRP